MRFNFSDKTRVYCEISRVIIIHEISRLSTPNFVIIKILFFHFRGWQVTSKVYNKGMDNMNNTISQESIDSLNIFIANHERERHARKAREEQARKDAYERAMCKREELESSFSYNLAGVAKDMLELASNCLAGLAKFALVASVLLSPYILGVIIDKWL